MKKRSKKYKAAKEKIAAQPSYTVEEAVKLLKETSGTKFDASCELHIHLGIDPKKTEQMVRASVTLPHGTGKTLKVIAFVAPDKEKEAKDAGADIIGTAEVIKTIRETQKCDFDVAVATPDMMKALGPVAKTLGQKGLMPNPRTETVNPNIGQCITALRQGKITFKSDDTGNIHQMIGRISFEETKLKENAETFLDAVKRARPDTAKGTFLDRVTMCTTMGPSLTLSL